jgi:phosphohistidine phosphatase SixA
LGPVTDLFRFSLETKIMRKVLVATCVIALAAWWPQQALAQRAVYLVRHADKQDDSLSADGKLQAGKLAVLLKDAGITAIYTTQFKRTKQTAAPLKALIEANGGTVRLETLKIGNDFLAHLDDLGLLESYAKSAAKTVREKSADEIVLIVGHDNTVPAIIKALGYQPKVTIQPTEFDHLFLLIPKGTGGSAAPGFLHLAHYAQ